MLLPLSARILCSILGYKSPPDSTQIKRHGCRMLELQTELEASIRNAGRTQCWNNQSIACLVIPTACRKIRMAIQVHSSIKTVDRVVTELYEQCLSVTVRSIGV